MFLRHSIFFSFEMCKVKTVFILLLIKLVFAQRGKPPPIIKACKYNNDITVTLVPELPPEENQYLLHILENIPKSTRVTLKFDSDAAITPLQDSTATITAANIQDHRFYLDLTKSVANLTLKVQGPSTGPIPHLTNFIIDQAEYCTTPLKGYLDQYVKVNATTASTETSIVNVVTTTTTERTRTVTRYDSCGRRKVHHVELVVNGFPTKPGDWPWHAAIYRLERARIDYICGGTLLNKFFVLTAAHCVALRGVAVLPESRNVILGKFNLVGGDIAPQEREVYQIIVHEGFLHTVLDNDIALMKLKSEAIYNDYVQPACLWHPDIINKIPEKSVHGTVVGWGFDLTDSLASTLQQVTVPIVSELKCIKSNPLFFVRLLNEQKFCAGHNNGSSACNGDSGGGFLVYVPDESGNSAFNAAAGTWFLRGIVSLSVSRSDVPICDPRQYVIFTDVSKFNDWLNTHMN